jgi:NAD(P)-dependent dehydrogenase (short-subunit alcohol dehydrogenase family)
MNDLPLSDRIALVTGASRGIGRAAALALAVFAPVIAWNASHDWASFAFQGARAGGLSDAQAQTCAQDDAAMKLLNDRVQRSYEVDKIDSTPTFYVGDRKLAGEQTLTALDAVIQPLLKQ